MIKAGKFVEAARTGNTGRYILRYQNTAIMVVYDWTKDILITIGYPNIKWAGTVMGGLDTTPKRRSYFRKHNQ